MFPSADEAKVYLTGLAETVPSISNVKAYAQIVQEKYLVRQLMDVAKDILQDAGTSRTPTCCWKMPSSASTRSAPAGFQRPDPAFLQHGGDPDQPAEDQRPGCRQVQGHPHRFRLLDTVLTGLGRGDLIILAPAPAWARPVLR